MQCAQIAFTDGIFKQQVVGLSCSANKGFVEPGYAGVAQRADLRGARVHAYLRFATS